MCKRRKQSVNFFVNDGSVTENKGQGSIVMDYKLLMKTAILAGEIMLKSGAETYRVEDTINRILQTSHAQTTEVVVLMTGIFATLDNPDIETITVIRRVESRANNLSRIASANDISRKYCAGEISLEEAYERLRKIRGKQYKRWIYNCATVFICAGFAPLFGGGILEICGSAAVGATLALLVTIGKKLRMHGFIQDVLSSIGIALTAIGLKQYFPGMDMDIVIISGIMPLVPGVAITNGIRDTLQGDYLSGGARMLEAFLIAASVALGVGIAMAMTGIMRPGGGMI